MRPISLIANFDTLYGGGGNDVLGSSIVGPNYWDGGEGDDYLWADWTSSAWGNFEGGNGNDMIQMGRPRIPSRLTVVPATTPSKTAAPDLRGQHRRWVPITEATAKTRFTATSGNDLSTAAMATTETSHLQLLMARRTGGLYGGDGDDISTAKTATTGSTWRREQRRPDRRGGNDSIFGGTGIDNIYGGNGADLIDAGYGADVVDGYDGADVAYLSEGADKFYGGAGADFAYGDIGEDVLVGGEGNDDLRGADGVDALFGGSGNDYYFGGAGTDYFYTTWDGPNTSETDFVLDFSDAQDWIVMHYTEANDKLIFDASGYTWIAVYTATGFHYSAFTGTTAAAIVDNIIYV